MEASSKTERRWLRRLLDDPKALWAIGANVVRSLLDGDHAVSYPVDRDTVRTRPMTEGEPMDVKGGE